MKTLLSSRLVKSDWAWSPPLKFTGSIFIWRRGTSWYFLFSVTIPPKHVLFFVHLRRVDMNKTETDRVIVFLQMIFDRNWPLTVNQFTKPKTNLKLTFVVSAKLPIGTKKSGHFHFLKMLKANLLRNGPTPKILEKVDTLILFGRPRLKRDRYHFEHNLEVWRKTIEWDAAVTLPEPFNTKRPPKIRIGQTVIWKPAFGNEHPNHLCVVKRHILQYMTWK